MMYLLGFPDENYFAADTADAANWAAAEGLV
jgi:hypothetical protein